jgi:hypothetical protein
MNGAVVFGVALIAVGLFVGGPGLLPILIGGVAVAAYGAFAPVGRRRTDGPQRPPSDGDPFV